MNLKYVFVLLCYLFSIIMMLKCIAQNNRGEPQNFQLGAQTLFKIKKWPQAGAHCPYTASRPLQKGHTPVSAKIREGVPIYYIRNFFVPIEFPD